MAKYYLSISFCYHDSSIAISDNKKILLHLEAERYFKIKHYRFHTLEEVDEIVNYALNELNISIDDITKLYITKWNNLYKDKNVVILGKKFNPIYTSHHQNHIGTSFPSKYKKCVILCSDGGSEDGYTKLYYKKGNKIKLIEDLDNKVFTGKFYGTIAQMIIEPKGSKAHNSGVGKLMGLSAMGKYDKKIEKLIKENIDEINTLHFDNVDHLRKVFGLDDNYDKVWLNDYKKNLATTAHMFWVNNCIDYLKKHNKYSKNLCLVGGCALNISLNSKLIDDGIFDNVYVSPISSDSGQALGALLYHNPKLKCDYPYLGYGKDSNYFYDETVIDELVDGKIISWYQGRSEIGARALGHRSFIGIPTSEDMRIKISEKVKGREPYRPVACIIPYEEVNNYFYQNYKSPYMTFCAKARPITKKKAKAIVHFDGTTRVQTLTKEENPIIYDILIKLKERIGVPILMNTSLNVMGDPIADTIEDAIETHNKSKADSLYINGVKYDENILISLLIATYNNKKVLVKTLDSFKKNGIFKDKKIEVIIVENCDKEEVYEETKKLEKDYDIKVYHEKQQGKSSALNKGISVAKGKYIYSTDDDVIVKDKNWLYKFVDEFEQNPNLGYCSGKVSMYKETSNEYSLTWEKKGGLSKGEDIKYWSYEFLKQFKYKIKPWPLHKMCAGANQMIRKDVLLQVGGYATFLGQKNTVDGLTLEIGYKIAKNGYELKYNPDIEIYHKHPTDEATIKKKLYYYGMQDTGVSMYIFLENHDYRYLWWVIFGHSCYTIKKMILHLFGKYSLSFDYLKYGLKGNLKGFRVCLKEYRRMKKNGNNI